MEFDIGNQFIGELFITSESKTVDFSDSDIFVDERNTEKWIGKLKTSIILCASQWNICQAELKEVNFERIC